MPHSCPSCERDDFVSERGMKCHHKMTHGESIAGIVVECDTCGKPHRKLPSAIVGRTFCSEDCRREEYQKLPEELEDFHRSEQWERKRTEIRKRDGYTCVWCDVEGDNLPVHHIRPMCEGGAPLDNKNLITLCKKCHFWAHKAITGESMASYNVDTKFKELSEEAHEDAQPAEN